MKKILAAILVLLTICTFSEAKKKRPVIGIAPSISGTSTSVGADYVESVIKAGGIPVIIPLMHDKATTESIISMVDGLIVVGGVDVNPAYYGESILNETVYLNAIRDTSDMLIIAAADKKGIPMLGICRGEQVINVFYGGSLYQDIPSQKPSDIAHRQKASKSTGTHLIKIEQDSRLAKLLQKESVAVNSFHHQAVKDIADCFTVTARAEDGIVEAYEGKNIICVQFHPEGFINEKDNPFFPLFQDLVKKASKKGRR